MEINGNNEEVSNEFELQMPSNGLDKLFAEMPEKGNTVTKQEDQPDPKKEENKEDAPNAEKTQEEKDKEALLEKEAKDKKAEEERLKQEAAEKEQGQNNDDDDDDEDSPIYALATAFEDVELEGDFENSAEGLVEATKQIISKKVEKAEKEAIENLFETKPHLKVIDEHLEKGGTLLSLLQGQQVENFEKRELKEDDVEGLEEMYTLALKAKGTDEDEIEDLVSAAKDKGILFTKATNAKAYLVAKQKDIIDKQLKDEQDAKADELKQAKAVEDKIKGLLNARKINGMEITEDTAKRLEDFAFKVDKQGKTERDKKWDNLTTEQALFIDMLLMDDFKPALAGKSLTQTGDKKLKFKVKKASPTVNLNTGGKTSKEAVAAKSIEELGITNLRDLF